MHNKCPNQDGVKLGPCSHWNDRGIWAITLLRSHAIVGILCYVDFFIEKVFSLFELRFLGSIFTELVATCWKYPQNWLWWKYPQNWVFRSHTSCSQFLMSQLSSLTVRQWKPREILIYRWIKSTCFTRVSTMHCTYMHSRPSTGWFHESVSVKC